MRDDSLSHPSTIQPRLKLRRLTGTGSVAQCHNNSIHTATKGRRTMQSSWPPCTCERLASVTDRCTVASAWRGFIYIYIQHRLSATTLTLTFNVIILWQTLSVVLLQLISDSNCHHFPAQSRVRGCLTRAVLLGMCRRGVLPLVPLQLHVVVVVIVVVVSSGTQRSATSGPYGPEIGGELGVVHNDSV
jgi:hypothetical protein